MPKTRRPWTNFSKGEISPLLEGRPDLVLFQEGSRTLENVLLLRQGGVTRRPGTRFVAEVKDSSKDTILLPFEFSVDDAYVIEAGDTYFRFYKDKATIKMSAGGPLVEVVSPYTEAQLRAIHFTQSADVLFLFHPDQQQRRLSRVSDTNWALSAITYTPPPSFEADTDIGTGASAGADATLTPGATTGEDVLFTASQAVFYQADVGRLIIAGAARAVITGFGASAGDTTFPNTKVRADILDAFPNTDPIAAGDWLLRLSPQTTLDPNILEPVGAQITLVAGVNAFRTADVGKFIFLYGGLSKITIRDSATQVKGEILSVLADATQADPDAAPAGSWTLEEASWSAAGGFPRTGEFFQGRLYQASTAAQPTTFWGSRSDDFDNYAVGAAADDAVEFTVAARQVNRIEWVADNIDLFLGTTGSEHRVVGGQEGVPIGGDVVPLVQRLTTHGCAPMQPVVISRRTIFVDRSRLKVLFLGFELADDGFDATELTVTAEHVTKPGLRLGPIGVQRRSDLRLYWVRDDGQLITLTFLPKEKVVGFTRLVTDGAFEAVAVIPRAAGKPDHVWVIVKRTIGGQTKRYVEILEEEHEDLTTRLWASLQTDSAVVYKGSATTTITGLSHLEGKTVDVIADGGFRGTKVVASGQITLDEAASEVEVGLHYDSEIATMRPQVEGAVLDGLPRSWDSVFARLKDSLGGTINGEPIQYPPIALGALTPYTGDVKVTTTGWDTDGRIRIVQHQPYPFTLLLLFGTLTVAEHD